jgi:fluoroacetyl-CoA thioesterase
LRLLLYRKGSTRELNLCRITCAATGTERAGEGEIESTANQNMAKPPAQKEKLRTGRTLEVEWVAAPEHSAENFGNPGVPVFATPAVVWLLDSLAHQVIVPTLEQEQGTLGTKISIEHLAATPMGMKVRARAQVVQIDGKRVLVKVEAHDEVEIIARGTIERYITGSIPKFLERTYAKKKNSNA